MGDGEVVGLVHLKTWSWLEYTRRGMEYDEGTNNLIEVVSSYFSNAFYNSLHSKASESFSTNGAVKSLDREYLSLLQQYVLAVRGEQINSILAKLYVYHTTYIRTITSENEFQKQLTLLFIPVEFYKKNTQIENDSILRKVIIKLVNATITFIKEPTTLPTVLHSRSIVAITGVKEFVRKTIESLRNDFSSSWNGDEITKVSVTALTKLNAEILAERSHSLELNKKLASINKILAQKDAQITKLQKICQTLVQKLKELQATTPAPPVPTRSAEPTITIPLTTAPEPVAVVAAVVPPADEVVVTKAAPKRQRKAVVAVQPKRVVKIQSESSDSGTDTGDDVSGSGSDSGSVSDSEKKKAAEPVAAVAPTQRRAAVRKNYDPSNFIDD